jgi:hypothetical protein
LTNGKLSTSIYNVTIAKAEFAFIDVNFIPSAKTDPSETEDPCIGTDLDVKPL